MSNDFDKYLAIANHDIQMANNDGQLKSYVASILYDYDKNVEQLLLDKCKAELEVERLNNIINDLLKRQNEALNYISNFLSMDNRYKHGNGNDELELVRRILNKHNQEPKGSDKEC